MRPEDQEKLDWVLEFNKFDLYSKVVCCERCVAPACR